MGVLGDATPGISKLVDDLPGIEKFTDDERSALTAGISKIAADSIAQAGSVIQADLAPLIEESKHWRAIFAFGFVGSIGGIPFQIKAMVPADPSIAVPGAPPGNSANSFQPIQNAI